MGFPFSEPKGKDKKWKIGRTCLDII